MLVAKVNSIRIAEKAILDATSFTISKGEIVGLTGKSGAGKTTFIRNLVKPKPQSSTLVGSMNSTFTSTVYYPQKLSLPNGLKFKTHFEAVSKKLCAEEKTFILEGLGVTELMNKTFGNLSGGQYRLAILACCCAAKPDLLILDEPLTGVDLPRQISAVSFIETMFARGDIGAILIVSHSLESLLFLCERILIVRNRGLTEINNHHASVRRPKSAKFMASPKLGEIREKIIENISL